MTVRTADAWRAFAGVLADAGSALEFPGLELDDLDRAHGLRYLARLVETPRRRTKRIATIVEKAARGERARG